jgi:hypothetical protein
MSKLFSATPNQIVQAAMKEAMKDVRVPKVVNKLKMENCPISNDCLHRQTKCGKCVDKSEYQWDYTQMI